MEVSVASFPAKTPDTVGDTSVVEGQLEWMNERGIRNGEA